MGFSKTVSGAIHAFLWTPPEKGTGGTMEDLGTLHATDPRSFATGINDGGWVVGYSGTGLAQRAFLWKRQGGVGTMVDLETLGGDSSSAWAINASGTVVGSSETASGETHAFLRRSRGLGRTTPR